MKRFLAERYWPGVTERAAADALERLDTAATTLARHGTHVRCVHTTFVPGEESVLWVFEAGGRTDVERCAAEAAVPLDRITESIELGG